MTIETRKNAVIIQMGKTSIMFYFGFSFIYCYRLLDNMDFLEIERPWDNELTYFEAIVNGMVSDINRIF